MKILSFLFIFLFCIVSASHGEKSCNDLILPFLKYGEKTKIETNIVSSIKKEYPDSPFSKIANDIAKELSKEIVCSQAEDKTTKIIERVMDLFENEIDEYLRKKDEYVKFIRKIVKNFCSKMDK